GVHVVPTELDLKPCEGEAVVIPVMLASMKKELLHRQLGRRGGDRNVSAGDSGCMDDIWALQSWLLDEADRAGVYIIENGNLEQTVRSILDLVIGVIMKRFPPRADDSTWEA
ncbi:MAG: hypothetical protein R3308_10335, partial [Thiohalobacterales bacterium]|nr:hypothetical protein [Thiohalobacterales bacterium]